MIGEQLNLDGRSLVNVFFPRETVEESDKAYSEAGAFIINRLHPFLAEWLEKEGIMAKIHACNSIKELEDMRVDLIYPRIFQDIAAEVNAMEQFNDTERMALLLLTADRMIKGAQDWYQGMGLQRVERIAAAGNDKKAKLGKILGLDGRPAKPGKIIT